MTSRYALQGSFTPPGVMRTCLRRRCTASLPMRGPRARIRPSAITSTRYSSVRVPEASFDLYNIDRVEVLRAPQGTLFGRNRIGGGVSVTTEHPSDRFSASAETGVGDYNHVRIGASLNGALVLGLFAGRLPVVSDKRDGFSYDVPLQQRVNNQNGGSVLYGVSCFFRAAPRQVCCSLPSIANSIR